MGEIPWGFKSPLRHKETPAVMAGVVSFSAQCLLRLDTSAPRHRRGSHPHPQSPHGRDLGQLLSQIAPMQRGLRMVNRCSALFVPS